MQATSWVDLKGIILNENIRYFMIYFVEHSEKDTSTETESRLRWVQRVCLGEAAQTRSMKPFSDGTVLYLDCGA